MQKKAFLFIVIIIVAAFIGAGYFFSNISAQYSGPPVLKVSEEVGELGKIKPDEVQVHVFTLKNEGGETLVIENVTAPCGCTATLLSSEEILPGGTAQLEVSFNPRGYKGEVSQSVYIYSNDPQTEKKMIKITADVEHVPEPEIRVSSNQWSLGLLSRGDLSDFSLKIINQGDLSAEIIGIEVPENITYESEEVEFPELLEPKDEMNLRFNFNSTEQEAGLFREYIRLITSDPRRKYVTIIVEGYITEGNNSVLISHLENTILEGNDETKFYEARFIVKNNSNEPVQIVSVESSVDYLEPVNNEKILLLPGKEQELVVKISKDNITDLYIGEKLQEYIYLNIALPVNIGS